MPSSRGKKGSALLDNLRLRHGNGRLPDIFHGLYQKDAQNAMLLLNDERLLFPSLYLLRHEVARSGAEAGLNARNGKALELSKKLSSSVPPGTYSSPPEDVPVLRWMLHTGHTEAALGDPYDRVMDFSAILLSREHQDKACLPVITNMIFARHRRRLYTHDAEWALFESRDPHCLDLIARRLLSGSGADAELARRLLGFIPCFGDPAARPVRQYRCAAQWISRNRARLRYTGLGSQQGPNPRRFEVVADGGREAQR